MCKTFIEVLKEETGEILLSTTTSKDAYVVISVDPSDPDKVGIPNPFKIINNTAFIELKPGCYIIRTDFSGNTAVLRYEREVTKLSTKYKDGDDVYDIVDPSDKHTALCTRLAVRIAGRWYEYEPNQIKDYIYNLVELIDAANKRTMKDEFLFKKLIMTDAKKEYQGTITVTDSVYAPKK
jgi:hypothetical protein